MRVIAGKHKGKEISYFSSHNTRPLRDAVRENIFNLIIHSKLVNVNLKNSNVLDLYSGTGSFGIECISRNSKKITFVEKGNLAFLTLKKNVKNLNIEDQTDLFFLDVNSFLKKYSKIRKFDIVFFDPPYRDNEYLNVLNSIKNKNILKKKHLIIIHRETRDDENYDNLLNIDLIKKYGRSKVIFGQLA